MRASRNKSRTNPQAWPQLLVPDNCVLGGVSKREQEERKAEASTGNQPDWKSERERGKKKKMKKERAFSGESVPIFGKIQL